MSREDRPQDEHWTRHVRWVGLATLLSRCLGLARDAAMAARFGNGVLLDAFTVAFRIPNLARALLGEGALATAFLPAYVALREQSGSVLARRFAVAVILWLVIIAGVLLLIAEAALLVAGLWGPLSPEADLLRRLTLWLLPYMALICVAAQLGAILNAENHFLVPALVPAVLNAVWLIGLMIAGGWAASEQQLYIMCAAILFGGLLQVLIPLLALRRSGFTFDPLWTQATADTFVMARQLIPALGGLLVTQINVLLDSLIAWGFSAPPQLAPGGLTPLPSGTASALYFGQRLYQFPLGVFGVALGTVLFARLAQHAQSRQYDLLRSDFTLGLRYVAAIGIPASAGLVLIAQPLASLFFEYGAFSADDARTTAQMIAAYGCGVWAYCGLLIIHRGFYAVGDRLTPLRVSMAAVSLNLLLNLTLIWSLGGVALALGTSIVSALQCLLVGWLFGTRIGGWNVRSVAAAVLAALTASLVMLLVGAAALALLHDWPGNLGRLARVLLPAGLGSAAYLFTARLLKFRDPWDVLLRQRHTG